MLDEASQPVGPPSFKGKKNIYLCGKCGHGFVSLDVDHGTTPFMTSCLNCDGMAKSLMYMCPQSMLADVSAAVEWYTPTPDALAEMSAHVQEHVKTFGLISRRVDQKAGSG